MEEGFFRELRGQPIREIQEALASITQPFEPSELYVVAKEENVVDTSQRRSEVRKITDCPRLFDLMEPLLARLNAEDPSLEYRLLRNDVTHIRYQRGGFFSKHQDYLSVTSNLIVECSLLLCVTPSEKAVADQGGKTVLHLKQGPYASNATTTPGCALVFRKDLDHESTVLSAGEKHICMLNLWAMPKAAVTLVGKVNLC